MRNNNIDCLKAVCAAEVVFCHFSFFGSGVIDPHFAVPCFLMISGYFLYTTDSEKFNAKALKALRAILWLTLWASAVYAAYHFVFTWERGTPFVSFMQLRTMVLYNTNPFGYHLWYLQAYIYVLLILLALNKVGCLRLAWWWVAPSLLMCFLLGKYDILLFGREFYEPRTRNFLFLGLPFVGIGMWLRSHADTIQSSKWLHRWSPWLALLGMVVWIAEHNWLMVDGITNKGMLYVGGLLMSVFGMLTALTHSSGRDNWLSHIGRYYSLPIYVFHILVGWMMPRVFYHLPYREVTLALFEDWAAPVVLVATVGCIWLWRRGRKVLFRHAGDGAASA